MEEIKCKNYELCSAHAIPEINGEYCMCCGSWFRFGNGWDELTQVTTTDEINSALCASKTATKNYYFRQNVAIHFVWVVQRTY